MLDLLQHTISLTNVKREEEGHEMEREDQKTCSISPLIQISEEDGSGFYPENDINVNTRRREISEEVKRQLWLAGPLISVSLSLFSLQVISVMFVGHLGQLALSGASMATSFASITGFSLLVRH